jgi:dolichyl-phosphate mannosyltransferase polypeptide 2 regulatory subunit
MDDDCSLKDFFPPWEYSIYLPVAVLVAGVSGITAFFLKTTSKKKDTQKAK